VIAAVCGAIVAIAACDSSKSTGVNTQQQGPGTLALRLTDAPFLLDSVKSVDVFVVRVDGRIGAADSAEADSGVADTTHHDTMHTDTTHMDSTRRDTTHVDTTALKRGGWVTLATPNALVNLLAFQHGATLPLDSAKIPAGTYSGFRLVIDVSKSSITLKDGTVLNGNSSPGIMFPSASRTGIKIELAQGVTVKSGAITTLVIDFDIANSFVVRGNTIKQNGLLFKPVVRGTVQ